MGNSLRCCLACMLPCGALDVIRVVHLSGHVDEFACPLTAADVLAAHPNHALTAAGCGGGARKIAVMSPDSDLKRGRIYFLIPTACSAPAADMMKKRSSSGGGGKKRHAGHGHGHGHRHRYHHHKSRAVVADTAEQDNYLHELLSEKRATSSLRRRRSGVRAGVWRPRLESIAEEPASDELCSAF